MSDVLHYPGDCTNYDERLIYGPDMYGAHYRAIGASYDKDADRTTLELKVIPPAELAKIAENMAEVGVPLWEGFYARPSSPV